MSKADAELNAAVKQAAHMPKTPGPATDAEALLGTLPEDRPPRAAPQKGPAEWAYERIVQYIRNFEAQLDANQEVAMGFAGSDAGVLKIEGLGFYEPDMLTFYGRDDDGMKTQLIQHIAQLSVMLRAVPKAQPAEPPRRIGFHLSAGWVGGEAGDASA
jgi:Family of unknown function (DUF6173)